MKKLFLLAVVVLIAFSSNAQRYGLRLGGNFADMKNTVETRGEKIAPGMQIGLLTELGPKMVSVRVEANFAQKGYNINFDGPVEGLGDVVQKSKVNFSYIEIPVLAKVKVFGPMYVYAGPYFGFAFKGNAVNDTWTIDGTDILTNETKDINIFKIGDYNDIPYKRTDFGAAAGLGAQFGIGPIHLFAEGRATIGLSNLYDTESDAWNDLVTNDGWKDDEKLKNMVWTVAVGILLGK